jgi:hypothetical protein
MDKEMKQRLLASQERYLSSKERTTTCQVASMACPDNSEADVITFEQSSEEIDTTRTRLVNQEETEAAVERQELREEETYFDTIGSLADRCEDQRLAVRRHQEAKKQIQDSVGSQQKSSAAHK